MAVSKDPSKMYNAPIPGSSLTNTPNSTPWQQAPQFTKEEDALNYFWHSLLQNPQTVIKLMVLLKGGVSVTEIVNTLLFSGIAGSKWTLDLALLMYQEVAWMIEALAKIRGIKYTFKRLDPKYAAFLLKYRDYIQEPAKNEPVAPVANKLFSNSLKPSNTNG